VTLTENPSETLEDAEGLAQYDLLFSDYNGPEWSEAAKANFEQAVSGGTGLVILHAADNSFPGWVEYEKMVGLADNSFPGWVEYEKMVGLLWREGTGHGEFHEFPVTIIDREHPITQGVEDFRIMDELYHRLLHMHDVAYHVIATAYSAEDKGGTGNDEPMMVVTQYGEGRVFHQVLGHIWPGDPEGEYKGAGFIALENPGFVETTIRGSEWAATGDVS